MRISVAIATYNGAKYIEEQLKSICNQTMPPNEVVISDDLSNDTTLNIIHDFSLVSPVPILVVPSKEKLGYARNFEKAIQHCSGDIIFLADQDDFFFKTKFEKIYTASLENKKAYIFINNMILTDEDLTPTQFTQLGNQLAIGQKEKDFILGCGSCIRADFKKVAFPIPQQWKRGHDLWFHTLAEAICSRAVISETLQYYRRHDQNVSQSYSSSIHATNKITTIKKSGLKNVSEDWILQLERERLVFDRLIDSKLKIEEFLKTSIDKSLESQKNKIHSIENRIRHCNKPKLKRVCPLTTMFVKGEYNHFNGYKSFIKDLIRY